MQDKIPKPVSNKQMRAYINKRFRKIDASFQKTITGYSLEDVHLFRVQVKKLRAFLRLIRTEFRNSVQVKLPKRLRKIYKKMGDIRLMQMQREKVEKNVRETAAVLPENYLNLLSAELNADMIAMAKLTDHKKSFGKERKKTLQKLPSKLHHTSIEDFILAGENRIPVVLSEESPNDESLHGVRKILKDFQYCWPYIKGDATGLLPAELSRKDSIKKITSRIGEFHDISAAISLLAENGANQITVENEKDSIFKMKNAWEKDKVRLGQQLSRKLRSYFN